MKLTFRLQGLTCDACVKLSEMKIKKINGVNNIKYIESKGLMEVESEQPLDLERIRTALAGTPYKALPL